MIVGIVSETYPGEHRVAMTPAALPALLKTGAQVVVQRGAGDAAGFSDGEYEARGCRLVQSRSDLLHEAELVCQVRIHDAGGYRRGQTLVGLADPLSNPSLAQLLAGAGVRCFAMELLPRITRAQAMDVLSSQATISGYKAVLLAAERLPRMAPMMTTAAGTIPAAKAFVIGAGVAGLQAIASSRKLGAVVTAYDVRPAVKEQVQSLGARFLELDLKTEGAEDKGGYAKAMDEEFYRRQREMMAKAVGDSDIVISTAAIPGKPPPVLITADAVRRMPRGSVVVDLAARPGATGGNCELTRPDEAVAVPENHATVFGPTNLPSTVPQTASNLFARNIATFLANIIKDGAMKIDTGDEITRETMLCDNGEITSARVRDLLKTPDDPQPA